MNASELRTGMWFPAGSRTLRIKSVEFLPPCAICPEGRVLLTFATENVDGQQVRQGCIVSANYPLEGA